MEDRVEYTCTTTPPLGRLADLTIEEENARTLPRVGVRLADQRMEEVQDLLPGIPDEISIGKVAAKLPWTAFPILASVSRGWRRAIWSGQVYDARVLSKCTQTLVAWINPPSARMEKHRIALHSIDDGVYEYLPPIPGLKEGIPRACGCISLNGRLYILGGSSDGRRTLIRRPGVRARAEVYVLDVYAERQWKECAKMDNAREAFGCAPMDGKIYVFGGSSDGRPVYGSEVYDPMADSWSAITPMPSLRFSPSLRSSVMVSIMGEELVVHGGWLYSSEFLEGNRYRVLRVGDRIPDVQRAVHGEVYHPLKNEWRILEIFTCTDKVVMVGGKFVKLNPAGLQFYDFHSQSWEPSRPAGNPFARESTYRICKASYSFRAVPDVLAAAALGDEVLAIVLLDGKVNEDADHQPFLIKSQGVGGKIEDITWQIVPNPFTTSIMCPILL